MPFQLTAYRIFIASPSGLQDERQTFRKIVEEFNETVALPRSVLFRPIGWEDTLGGVGRPQEIINEELKQCDYFLMLLWDRWGSRPDTSGRFSSGTEEEFHLAKQCLVAKDYPMSQIAIFFKAVDSRQLSDPGEELKKVISFRKTLEKTKEHLYNTFDDIGAFQDRLRKFLNRWLMEHEERDQRGAIWWQQIAPEELLPPESSSEPIPVPSKLVAQAMEFQKQGKFTDAESAFSRAVESGTDPEALLAYSNFLKSFGRYSQAQTMLERLLSLSVPEKWQARAHSGLGWIYIRRNRLMEAEQSFRTALEIAQKLDMPNVRADQLLNIGRVLTQRHELRDAEAYVTEALSIFKRLEQKSGTAYSQAHLGEIQRLRGDFDLASQNYEEAMAVFKGLQEKGGIAMILNNAALLHLNRGELDKAEKGFREALELNMQLQRLESIALNHRNLGDIEERRGNLHKAKEEIAIAAGLYATLGLEKRVEDLRSRIQTIEISLASASKPPAVSATASEN